MISDVRELGHVISLKVISRHLECNENENGAFVVREGTLFIPNEMHMFSTPHRSIITFTSSELPSC